MKTATALDLLGPLASLGVQRRYIVHGSMDGYLLPTEVIEDAHAFLRHPLLGETGSLASVAGLALVLEEHAPSLPLGDAVVCNRTLVKEQPDWARIRDAAQAVLEEMGADLETWEREQLDDGGAG